MKTVSGKIVTTKPVKLSKAATILSKFVNSDNGASQAVSAYLCRASEAFNELVYLKKHHKTKRSRSKEVTSTKSAIRSRNLEEGEVRVLENGGLNRGFSQNPVEVDEKGTKNVEGKLRKKKKKVDDSLGSGKNDNIEVEFEEGNEIVKEKSEDKKKKKKRKNVEVDRGEIGNSVSPERKKKSRSEAAQ